MLCVVFGISTLLLLSSKNNVCFLSRSAENGVTVCSYGSVIEQNNREVVCCLRYSTLLLLSNKIVASLFLLGLVMLLASNYF